MTRILVFGAGAIGQWVAARFSLAGAAVVVVCRPAAAQAVREHGLTVSRSGSPQPPLHAAQVTAVESAAELAGGPAFDWVFLTVKAFDVSAALLDLDKAGLLAPPTRVMGFQNGVGTEAPLADHTSLERAFTCVVTRPIAMGERPGTVIESAQKGGLAVAPMAPGHDLGTLLPELASFGAPVLHVADYRAMKWSKLLLNMTTNATCAIADVTPAQVFTHRRLFALEQQAFCEALACMRAMGIRPVSFPDYPARLLAHVMGLLPGSVSRRIMHAKASKARGSKQPSLRLEMEAPRPSSEIVFLNGGVSTKGRELGIPTPANDFIAETLMRIVTRELPWDVYRHQPDRLCDAFEARKT